MFAQKFKNLHYKKLFLYGAYTTIISLAIPASVIDYLIGSDVDVVIDLAFALLTFVAFKFSFNHEEPEWAPALIFWIATLFELVYLSVHDIDFDLIFSVLIPLIAFISMSKQKIKWHLFGYYIVLLGYLLYGYMVYPDHPYLHDSRFMLALGISHGFIIAFGFFYTMAIEESLVRLEASNRTKTLLLSEVHHRVKNNLNLIASILGLQVQRRLNPEADTVLEENRRRIESMAILHEILYKKENIGHVDLRMYLETLIDHIIQSETMDVVEVERTIAPIILPIDQMILMGIMLNEMVTNSIKHSADTQGHVSIMFHFAQQESGYMLQYCDTASDIKMGKLDEGFGLTLIHLTAEQLKGTVKINTAQGMCYTIVFDGLEGGEG